MQTIFTDNGKRAKTVISAELNGELAQAEIETYKTQGRLFSFVRVFTLGDNSKTTRLYHDYSNRICVEPCPRISKKLVQDQHERALHPDNLRGLRIAMTDHYEEKNECFVFTCEDFDSITASKAA